MSDPEIGDTVVPTHPVRGHVVKRDVRGGVPGCLVRWPGVSYAMWHPDGDLIVVPGGHVAESAIRRRRAS